MKYKDPWADSPALRLENEQLHAENKRLRAALEQVEWGGEPDGQCPYCLQTEFWGASGKPWGHTSGCVIGKALARQTALRQSEGE